MNTTLINLPKCAVRIFGRSRFFATQKLRSITKLTGGQNLSWCRYLHSSNYLYGSDKSRDDGKINLETGETTLDQSKNIPGSIAERYTPFEDRQRVIQDVIDEEWDPQMESEEKLEPVLFERGKTGVFDLQELVDLLEEERAFDICVIEIPKELHYADHMMLVSVRSQKHMFALATFIRKRFKSKKLKETDVLPRIEGNKDSNDWIAIDLGNIVLHIFEPEFREKVDLETLWTVGPKYDDLYNQKDSDIVQLLKMFQ